MQLHSNWQILIFFLFSRLSAKLRGKILSLEVWSLRGKTRNYWFLVFPRKLQTSRDKILPLNFRNGFTAACELQINNTTTTEMVDSGSNSSSVKI